MNISLAPFRLAALAPLVAYALAHGALIAAADACLVAAVQAHAWWSHPILGAAILLMCAGLPLLALPFLGSLSERLLICPQWHGRLLGHVFGVYLSAVIAGLLAGVMVFMPARIEHWQPAWTAALAVAVCLVVHQAGAVWRVYRDDEFGEYRILVSCAAPRQQMGSP